ncbi:hypothetical protein OAO87_03930, partial [bacterium]|nr:hypothetical protein [bacterium]
MDEVKRLVALLKKMYNIRLRGHQIAKLGVLKRIMYAVKMHGEWPRADNISLEAVRRSPHDKALTLFSRLVWSVVLCAAGTGVPVGKRDDAGHVDGKYPAQWASAEAARA